MARGPLHAGRRTASPSVPRELGGWGWKSPWGGGGERDGG